MKTSKFYAFMKTSKFFAFIARMKLIKRWALMNNTIKENIAEHSLQVAMFAQMLVVLHNKHFSEDEKLLNPETAAVIAMYHDVTEVITGDMPTPIKYFNKGISKTYKEIENLAAVKISNMLPEDIRGSFSKYILVNNEYKEYEPYVKAADKLSAFVKCIEEIRMGNDEFEKAKQTIKHSLSVMNMPEVDMFIETFIPAFSLTLDEF